MRGRTRGSPGADRWSRKDWWGVVLDCPEPRVLAEFYSAITGWPIWKPEELDDDPSDVALDAGEGVGYLSFQRDHDYERPVWPQEPGRPRMMLHLDFEVDDLAAAVADAIELGATLPDFQPQDDVRVLLDPAGHPFCLYG